METVKTLCRHQRLGSTTLLQLAFPRDSNPNFQWDNTVEKKLKRNMKGKLKKSDYESGLLSHQDGRSSGIPLFLLLFFFFFFFISALARLLSELPGQYTRTISTSIYYLTCNQLWSSLANVWGNEVGIEQKLGHGDGGLSAAAAIFGEHQLLLGLFQCPLYWLEVLGKNLLIPIYKHQVHRWNGLLTRTTYRGERICKQAQSTQVKWFANKHQVHRWNGLWTSTKYTGEMVRK